MNHMFSRIPNEEFHFLVILLTYCFDGNGIFLPKLFSPTVRKNCSSDLKNFANSRPSASNFKKNSRSLEQFFLTEGQNNFGNKIPFLYSVQMKIVLSIFTDLHIK